jgi:hypothetical protein
LACASLPISNEPEPARFTTETVAHYIDAVYLHTGLCEEALQIGLGVTWELARAAVVDAVTGSSP